MRMFMTDGMFGRCLEQIGYEMDSLDVCMKELATWKACDINKKFYKIESYDRIIFGENGYVAIDFGDYKTFMLILGATEKQIAEFNSKKN